MADDGITKLAEHHSSSRKCKCKLNPRQDPTPHSPERLTQKSQTILIGGEDEEPLLKVVSLCKTTLSSSRQQSHIHTHDPAFHSEACIQEKREATSTTRHVHECSRQLCSQERLKMGRIQMSRNTRVASTLPCTHPHSGMNARGNQNPTTQSTTACDQNRNLRHNTELKKPDRRACFVEFV